MPFYLKLEKKDRWDEVFAIDQIEAAQKYATSKKVPIEQVIIRGYDPIEAED